MQRNECRCAWAVTVCLLAPSAGGQTIGDYSRVQAAALERSMVQAIGRPLATPESARLEGARPAPVPGGSVAASVATDGLGQRAHRRDPDILLSGVFAARAKTAAELSVDGTPYWLEEGDVVPRTPWAVRKILPDRVELERRAPARPNFGGRTNREIRTVSVPSTRRGEVE